MDAVYLAMGAMKHARYARRALLILSDGGDNDSRYTQAEMLRRVREADLWIYAMGIYDRSTAILPEEARPARELLEALAEESGGRHYAVESAGGASGGCRADRAGAAQPVCSWVPAGG